MRIAVIGAGPGGLLFAGIAARSLPGAEVDVFERNAPGDAFGFGVVFSDATQRGVDEADSALRETLDRHGRRWDTIEVRLKGERFEFGGNGMGAVLRADLLRNLQSGAANGGAHLHFSQPVSLDELRDYDVIVAADGANSRTRAAIGDEALGVSYDVAVAKFIWFATPYQFDGLTFVHAKDEGLEGVRGVFAAHAYPIGGGLSTFIVETDEPTWRAAGLDGFDPAAAPGTSDEYSQRELERIFAPQIEGARLVANNSRWANFRTIRAETWHHGNVVFLGDAVHTAHFSVGSGTKMALEDAIALAGALVDNPTDIERAFADYEAARQPLVTRIQDSARPSLSWWEHFGEYYGAMEPWQFAFHFFSRAIPAAKIARRDPAAVEQALANWRRRHGSDPLTSPLQLGDAAGRSLHLDSRLLASRELPGAVAVLAPEHESDIAEVLRGALAGPRPSALLVHGGSSLMRQLTAEAARFEFDIPAVIVDPTCDDDLATTLVLSGRADAVAR